MHRVHTCSPATLEQISYGGERWISTKLCRELVESLLRLGQTHGAGRTCSTLVNECDGDDGRSGLSVTKDEDLLAAVLGLVHDLGKVGLHIGE
jgi:hypothetical protein